MSTETDGPAPWGEDDSQEFLTQGEVYVPARDTQLRVMCELIAPLAGSDRVVELCCGAGLLARAVLETYPEVQLLALDGSEAMVARARAELARFGARARVAPFQLEAEAWRGELAGAAAVVSSLAIHHLDAEAKRRLYRDVAAALRPGGTLVVADLVEPCTPQGKAVAARLWDEAVREAALRRDGDLRAFERFQATHWNHFSDPDPDPVDQPSPLFAQLGWFAEAGLVDVDVCWMAGGHAIFMGRRAEAQR